MTRLNRVRCVTGLSPVIWLGAAGVARPQRGRISRTVVDAGTGNPIAGAYVAIDNSGDAGGTNLGRFAKEGIYVTTDKRQKGSRKAPG